MVVYYTDFHRFPKKAGNKRDVRMPQKTTTFKKGQRVTACPIAMKDPKKLGQIMSRTGLLEEDLLTPMHVVSVDADQLKLRHQKLKEPFTVHSKFFAQAMA